MCQRLQVFSCWPILSRSQIFLSPLTPSLVGRLLWEENKRLHEEIKRLKAAAGREFTTGQSSRVQDSLPRDHPVLQALLDKHSHRQDSVADAISMLGQAGKERILVSSQASVFYIHIHPGHLLYGMHSVCTQIVLPSPASFSSTTVRPLTSL